ncbi:MAG: thiamine pyrophosphate-dependent enzyme [Candidatus Nealsonbacteria bacterium]
MMKSEDFGTKMENTWCPGCPNFGILQAVKEAFAELATEGKIKAKDISVIVGIGCHAKIFDYLNVNAFYGLHGRPLPVALGIKTSNPQLTVVAFGGDGDTFAEGISHFIHNCRHNANITMLVHNNQAFSLTTGQATPTTEKGFVGPSTPSGKKEEPINPVVLALVSGATFAARGSALDPVHLKGIIKKAIEHEGFSFVDILQPCLIFHDSSSYYVKNTYKVEGNNTQDIKQAMELAKEWDYSFEEDKKVPLGVFFEIKKPTFESQWANLGKPCYLIDRKIDWQKLAEEFK